MNENSIGQRNGLMAALSAAERLAAGALVAPSNVNASPGEVDLHFHRSAEAVSAFAEEHGLVLSLRREHGGRVRPYVQAKGRVDGLRVHAWTLGDEADMAAFEAVLAPSALPSAWSAAVSA